MSCFDDNMPISRDNKVIRGKCSGDRYYYYK